MIELYIDGKLADLNENVGIRLQKEYSSDGKSVTDAEFSYSLELPITDNNKVIFRFADTFDVSGKFNRTYDAKLYSDSSMILDGKFKLSEISLSEGYKGNLYSPKRKNISDILGDRTLNEIQEHYKMLGTMDDLTKTNNYVANLDAQNLPPSEYQDRHVCFPYLLYGVPYNAKKEAAEASLDMFTQDLEYGKHTISVDNSYPAFNVLSVLQDVFATEGYKLIGNIFSDLRFKDLYQTFQYDYNKWRTDKMTPYFLDFNCNYGNYKNYVISKTMRQDAMWEEEAVDDIGTDNSHFNGYYNAGIDAPLIAGKWNTEINVNSNDQNMLTKGESTDSYVIRVPQSGWYRIKCTGSMDYPQSSSANTVQDNSERVGGTTDEADCTDLSQQPFEFHIVKGRAMEDPKLYSFCSFTCGMPTEYKKDVSVKYHTSDIPRNILDALDIYPDPICIIELQTEETQRKYPKNGKTMLINDYSGYDTKALIGGARLGGAWFGGEFGPAYYGDLQREYRFALRGAGLALPRADRNLTIIGLENDPQHKYFYLATSGDNKSYEYAENTALVMAPKRFNDKQVYANFEGYNTYQTNGSWDTSATDAVTWYGADNSSAMGGYKNSGSWTINTCVWLEEGDQVDFEVVMPVHTSGHRKCCHSRWVNRVDWINITNVRFNYQMALVNIDEEWVPTQESPIKGFSDVTGGTPTNVNQFLPTTKCNDYLNGFLRTFNLTLTMPYDGVFSIDSHVEETLETNILDLDKYAHPYDASFHAVDAPSRRQLGWKINKDEVGYKIGNTSPYSVLSNVPWDVSGYDGSITIENEANTDGSVEKTESPWSYSWYRTIKFINGKGLTPMFARVNTLASANDWKENVNWNTVDAKNISNRPMRLFYLDNDAETGMYRYIEFPYAKEGTSNFKNARLLLTSNYMEKRTIEGTSRYYLDYNDNAVQEPNKTITDSFFSIQMPYQYEVEVDAYLPNDVYAQINGGTLVKFNGGLFKIVKVEGHDIEGESPCTITMRTLG